MDPSQIQPLFTQCGPGNSQIDNQQDQSPEPISAQLQGNDVGCSETNHVSVSQADPPQFNQNGGSKQSNYQPDPPQFNQNGGQGQFNPIPIRNQFNQFSTVHNQFVDANQFGAVTNQFANNTKQFTTGDQFTTGNQFGDSNAGVQNHFVNSSGVQDQFNRNNQCSINLGINNQSSNNMNQLNQFNGVTNQFATNDQFATNNNQFAAQNSTNQFAAPNNSGQFATGKNQFSTANQFVAGNNEFATGNNQFSTNNNQCKATGNDQGASGNDQVATGNGQGVTGNDQGAAGFNQFEYKPVPGATAFEYGGPIPTQINFPVSQLESGGFHGSCIVESVVDGGLNNGNPNQNGMNDCMNGSNQFHNNAGNQFQNNGVQFGNNNNGGQFGNNNNSGGQFGNSPFPNAQAAFNATSGFTAVNDAKNNTRPTYPLSKEHYKTIPKFRKPMIRKQNSTSTTQNGNDGYPNGGYGSDLGRNDGNESTIVDYVQSQPVVGVNYNTGKAFRRPQCKNFENFDGTNRIVLPGTSKIYIECLYSIQLATRKKRTWKEGVLIVTCTKKLITKGNVVSKDIDGNSNGNSNDMSNAMVKTEGQDTLDIKMTSCLLQDCDTKEMVDQFYGFPRTMQLWHLLEPGEDLGYHCGMYIQCGERITKEEYIKSYQQVRNESWKLQDPVKFEKIYQAINEDRLKKETFGKIDPNGTSKRAFPFQMNGQGIRVTNNPEVFNAAAQAVVLEQERMFREQTAEQRRRHEEMYGPIPPIFQHGPIFNDGSDFNGNDRDKGVNAGPDGCGSQCVEGNPGKEGSQMGGELVQSSEMGQNNQMDQANHVSSMYQMNHGVQEMNHGIRERNSNQQGKGWIEQNTMQPMNAVHQNGTQQNGTQNGSVGPVGKMLAASHIVNRACLDGASVDDYSCVALDHSDQNPSFEVGVPPGAVYLHANPKFREGPVTQWNLPPDLKAHQGSKFNVRGDFSGDAMSVVGTNSVVGGNKPVDATPWLKSGLRDPRATPMAQVVARMNLEDPGTEGIGGGASVSCDPRYGGQQNPMDGENEGRNNAIVEQSGIHQHELNSLGLHIPPFLGPLLREHQLDGIQFFYETLYQKGLEGALLCDSMGLGKTFTTLSFVYIMLVNKKINKVCVVCPASLCENWKAECEKWFNGSDCSKDIFNGSNIIVGLQNSLRSTMNDFRLIPTLVTNAAKRGAAKRAAGRKYGNNTQINAAQSAVRQSLKAFVHGRTVRDKLLILSYDYLREYGDEIRSVIDVLIIDEAHKLGHKKTAIAEKLSKDWNNKATNSISNGRPVKKILLTGTPLQNNVDEFKNVIGFLNPQLMEESGLNNLGRKMDKLSALAILRKTTNQFMLCRSSEILSNTLLPNHRLMVFVPNGYGNIEEDGGRAGGVVRSRNQSFCRKYQGIVYDHVHNGRGGGQSVLTCILRLRECCYEAKIDWLSDLLFNKFPDQKFVLVSGFTKCLDLIAELFLTKGLTNYLRLDGQTKIQERQKLVDLFNKPSFKGHFLLSKAAGGLGLNLIGGRKLVLLEPDWNPASDAQAMCRIWREGQKHTTFVYRPIIMGSVEELIMQRQEGKEHLLDQVLGRKLRDLGNLKANDVQDYFSLKRHNVVSSYVRDCIERNPAGFEVVRDAGLSEQICCMMEVSKAKSRVTEDGEHGLQAIEDGKIVSENVDLENVDLENVDSTRVGKGDSLQVSNRKGDSPQAHIDKSKSKQQFEAELDAKIQEFMKRESSEQEDEKNLDANDDEQNSNANDDEKNSDANDDEQNSDANDDEKNSDANDDEKNLDAIDDEKNLDANDDEQNSDANDDEQNSDANDDEQNSNANDDEKSSDAVVEPRAKGCGLQQHNILKSQDGAKQSECGSMQATPLAKPGASANSSFCSSAFVGEMEWCASNSVMKSALKNCMLEGNNSMPHSTDDKSMLFSGGGRKSMLFSSVDESVIQPTPNDIQPAPANVEDQSTSFSESAFKKQTFEPKETPVAHQDSFDRDLARLEAGLNSDDCDDDNLSVVAVYRAGSKKKRKKSTVSMSKEQLSANKPLATSVVKLEEEPASVKEEPKSARKEEINADKRFSVSTTGSPPLKVRRVSSEAQGLSDGKVSQVSSGVLDLNDIEFLDE